MWDAKHVAGILNVYVTGDPDVKVKGCVIDSRKVQGGEIFFALPGEKTDGHRFMDMAWKNGANLVIAEKAGLSSLPGLQVPAGKALIVVESGLNALHSLANTWRRELGAKVIGITGSNGKTTTKDMVAAVLAPKYRVYKNLENQNNELGLPMTILNAPENTEILVLEMGMRGLGQIRALCTIAQPDIGVITNIGTTHLELLGSQENIAQAKWELIEALPEHGIAVLNAEDYWSVQKAEADSHPCFFYGIRGTYHVPDLRGEDLKQAGTLGTRFDVTLTGSAGRWAGVEKTEAYLPLPGEHNVLDALAALSVGKVLNVSLEEGCRGLAGMELSKMRLEIQPGIYGSTLISDVYNANPTSMQASLRVLQERSQRATLAILGEMYELGEASVSGHYDVGKTVAELGISELITVGALADDIARGAVEAGMAQEKVHPCPERAAAVTAAKKLLRDLGEGTWVLIKASRGMEMEEVTRALTRHES